MSICNCHGGPDCCRLKGEKLYNYAGSYVGYYFGDPMNLEWACRKLIELRNEIIMLNDDIKQIRKELIEIKDKSL